MNKIIILIALLATFVSGPLSVNGYVEDLDRNEFIYLRANPFDNKVRRVHADFRTLEDYKNYLQELEKQKWEKRMEEYPTATKVWLCLKEELGYNDAICAGILGNMMAECGGQTLNLNWRAVNKTSGCYGLCQWHPLVYRSIQGGTLEEQLAFMIESFPTVLKQSLGIYYRKGFTYDDFLKIDDPELVSYIFCIAYERPGPGTYEIRAKNSLAAFEYFTS